MTWIVVSARGGSGRDEQLPLRDVSEALDVNGVRASNGFGWTAVPFKCPQFTRPGLAGVVTSGFGARPRYFAALAPSRTRLHPPSPASLVGLRLPPTILPPCISIRLCPRRFLAFASQVAKNTALGLQDLEKHLLSGTRTTRFLQLDPCRPSQRTGAAPHRISHTNGPCLRLSDLFHFSLIPGNLPSPLHHLLPSPFVPSLDSDLDSSQ